MTDIAVLSETQRQGEATRAALGTQLRLRKIWTGAERNAAGLPVQQWNLFKLRDLSTPVMGLENIAHNGTLYAASVPAGVVYSSTDLVTWTQRAIEPSSTNYKAMPVGGVWFTRTYTTGYGQHIRRSTDLVTSTWIAAFAQASACVSGNLLYLLGTGSTLFRTIDSAGVVTDRYSATNASWARALNNGAVTLLVDGGVTAIDVSANGVTGWAASAGLVAALARLPGGTRHIFVLGTKFVIVSFNTTAIYTITSEDGNTWSLAGKVNMPYGPGRSFNAHSVESISVGGWHYINVQLAITIGGTTTYEGVLLATPDGIRWRVLGPYHTLASAFQLAGLYQRVGTDSVLFNASVGGTPLEIDIDNAMESYYAV